MGYWKVKYGRENKKKKKEERRIKLEIKKWKEASGQAIRARGSLRVEETASEISASRVDRGIENIEYWKRRYKNESTMWEDTWCWSCSSVTSGRCLWAVFSRAPWSVRGDDASHGRPPLCGWRVVVLLACRASDGCRPWWRADRAASGQRGCRWVSSDFFPNELLQQQLLSPSLRQTDDTIVRYYYDTRFRFFLQGLRM